jgi:hypothetical protein
LQLTDSKRRPVSEQHCREADTSEPEDAGAEHHWPLPAIEVSKNGRDGDPNVQLLTHLRSVFVLRLGRLLSLVDPHIEHRRAPRLYVSMRSNLDGQETPKAPATDLVSVLGPR